MQILKLTRFNKMSERIGLVLNFIGALLLGLSSQFGLGAFLDETSLIASE